MNILLIDDNPQDNSGYIHELKKHHNVDVAMKISSAKRLLEMNQYDLIVIDVMMPTQSLSTHSEMITGYVFYDEIIRSKLNLKTRVLFWSHLNEESYDKFFSNTTPVNSSFLHKDSLSDDHLLSYINNMLCNSN